jgi:hypothetical protein
MLQILLPHASLPLHGCPYSSLSSWCWVWQVVSDLSSPAQHALRLQHSQSLAGPSQATGLIITGVKWGNKSWTQLPNGFDVGTTSASVALPSCSLTGSERLTTVCKSSGWSLPLLPNHAELAASEQAERDAARARRGGKPISRVLSARFDKMKHGRRRPADSDLILSPPPRQPIVDCILPARNA